MTQLKGQEAKNKYIEIWEEQVDTLAGLGWHLEGDDYEMLQKKMDELKELVKIASEDVDELTTGLTPG